MAPSAQVVSRALRGHRYPGRTVRGGFLITAQPNAEPETAPDPVVSVIIPARNEQDHISRTLRSVQDQDWVALEVLVIDGDSDDETRTIVAEHAARDPRVRLLHNPDRIVPAAMNVALNHARGEYLVRVDAHATIRPGYVRRAVAHLADPRWAGVGGRKDAVGETPAGRAIAAAMGSRFGVGNSTYHYGTEATEVEHVPFGCYRSEVARALGGWDESLPVNQDFEFDHRLRQSGHGLLFDPALVIDWQCRQNVPDLYRQYRRYGRGKVDVVRKHPGSMRARHAAAPALVASWALAAVVAPFRPRWAAALVLPYVAGLAAATAVTARKVDPQARAHVAPAFLAMHAGWGLGFWQALARHR